MKTKLIITENQFNKLKNKLLEYNAHSDMVKTIKEFLDEYYKPISTFMREGGEYFNKAMIENKVDGEVISPKSLYEYLKYKFEANDEFIKQVIKDWVSGSINDNYQLTKNVSL